MRINEPAIGGQKSPKKVTQRRRPCQWAWWHQRVRIPSGGQNLFEVQSSGRTLFFLTTTTSDAVSQGGVAKAEPREDPANKQSTIGPSGLVPTEHQWPQWPGAKHCIIDPVGLVPTCS